MCRSLFCVLRISNKLMEVLSAGWTFLPLNACLSVLEASFGSWCPLSLPPASSPLRWDNLQVAVSLYLLVVPQ